MADGLTPQIITQTIQPEVSKVTGAIDAVNKNIDGIHETIKKDPVVDALKSVGSTETSILAELEKLLPGISPIKECLDKLYKLEEEKKESGEESPASIEKAKKAPTEDELTKLPAKYAAGPLLISDQLKILFGETSSLFGKICEISTFLSTINSNLEKSKESKKDEEDNENKPIFTVKQIDTLCQELGSRIEKLQIVVKSPKYDKKSKEKETKEEPKKQEKSSDSKKVGGIKGLKEFTEDGKEVFTNILKMTGIVMAVTPLAIAATPGLTQINKFLKRIIYIGKEKPSSEPVKWKELTDVLNKEILPYLKSARKVINTLSGVMIVTGALIASVGFALIGLLAAGLFIENIKTLLSKIKTLEQDLGEIEKKKIVSGILKITKSLLVTSIFASLLIVPSLIGVLGLLSAYLFIMVFSKLGVLIKSTDKELGPFIKTATKLGKAILLLAASILLVALLPLAIFPALIGLGALILFLGVLSVVGLLLMTPLLSLGINRIKGISFKIAIAFLAFTVALIIIGIVMPVFIPGALMGVLKVILLFGVFLIVTSLAGLLSKQVVKFALASMLLSISLIIFTVALVIINLLYEKYLSQPGTMTAVTKIVVLFLIFILVGALASALAANLILFTIASILLSVSLVVFGVALVILSLIYDEFLSNSETLAAVISIIVIFLLFGVLAAVAGLLAPLIVAFALASILLSVALVIFSFTLIFLLIIARFIEENKEELLDGLKSIAIMFLLIFVVGLVSIFAIIGLALIVIATALMVIAGVLLLIGLKIFSIALNFLKENEMVSKAWLLCLLFLAIIVAGILALIALLPLVLLVIVSILLAIASIALLIGIFALSIVLEWIVTKDIVNRFGEITLLFEAVGNLKLLKSLGSLILLTICSILFAVSMVALYVGIDNLVKVSDKIKELNSGPPLDSGNSNLQATLDCIKDIFEGLPGMIFLVKAAAKSALLAVACTSLSNSFKDIVLMYEAMVKIKDMQGKVDPKPVFDIVKDLIQMAADAGQAMKGSSKKAAEAFAISLGAITLAIKDVIDIIERMGEFSGQKGQKKIEDALLGLKGPNGNDGIVSFIEKQVVPIISSLKGINEKQLNTAKALVPIIEGINSSIDLINKLAGIENLENKIKSSENALGALAYMFASGGLSGKIGNFIFGSESGGGGPISKFIDAVSGIGNTKKAIENIDDVVSDEGIINKAFELSEKMVELSDWKVDEDSLKILADNLGLLSGFFASSGLMGGFKKFFSGSKSSDSEEGPVQQFISSISSMPPIGKTVSKIDDSIFLLGKIKELSDATVGIEPIEAAITENIIIPLNNLDGPIERIDKLGKSIEGLNKSLNSITRGNREILQSMGKLANGGVLTIKFKEEKSKEESKSSNSGQDPLKALATDVGKICKKITNEESSWMEGA